MEYVLVPEEPLRFLKRMRLRREANMTWVVYYLLNFVLLGIFEHFCLQYLLLF